jgi:hypothetical protein
MADSKRAAAEEEYVLPVPPFDAEAYVRREVVNARATIVLAIYGTVLGQLSVVVPALVPSSGNILIVPILLLGFPASKNLLAATGVDTSGWDKKTWAGHIAVLFFTWLAAWILFLNKPFSN